VSKIEEFRAILQRVIDNTANSASPYSTAANNIARTIKLDYDRIFPSDVFNLEHSALEKLALEFCYQNEKLCPICGKDLTKKMGKYGMFFSCPSYPVCKGTRSGKGKLVFNDALCAFLASKIEQNKVKLDTRLARFSNLIDE
jgi:hypothetical protein